MEDLKVMAKDMLDSILITERPMPSYLEDINKTNNEYWKLHGKTICKNKLIKLLTGLINDLKLDSSISHLASYLIQPQIIRNEKLIEIIKEL